jgi:hypothetical protein
MQEAGGSYIYSFYDFRTPHSFIVRLVVTVTRFLDTRLFYCDVTSCACFVPIAYVLFFSVHTHLFHTDEK